MYTLAIADTNVYIAIADTNVYIVYSGYKCIH